MAGDGGLAMLLGELLTLRAHDLPGKMIVFNNSSLRMVKLEVLVDGFPEHETDHDPVDFAAIAHGAGLFARRVDKPGEVGDGIRELLAHPAPAVLDLVTDPNALSITPTATADEVRAFALAVGRTVPAGGVGKMLAWPDPTCATSPGPERADRPPAPSSVDPHRRG